MKLLARVPGAALAVGVFVLTVLLGAGAVSAYALWQQSATATMTVTANGNWPGPPITSLTCTNDSPEKIATLRITLSTGPGTLTYAALQANGSYGTSYLGPVIPVSLTPGSIVLTTNNPASQIIRDNPSTGPLTIRVTATYLDQTAATVELTLNHNSTSGKLVCP